MNNKKAPIKVLLVDDHPVVRKGLQFCLGQSEHLLIVGEAADGAEAVRKVAELTPDVVLMDIEMPGMNGLDATRAIRKSHPKILVLILSAQSKKPLVLQILQSGAHGYVLKNAPLPELVRAIDSVQSGQRFFSPDISQIVVNQYLDDADQSNGLSKLSDREREVLIAISEGQSNKDIANRLGVGVRTIETHRERVMDKLNIHNVAGLTKFAISNGLVHLEGK